MGIVGLSKWAKENSADCFRKKPLKEYAELKIAIGASMWLYQLLIAVRQDGEPLQNANGEATSHVSGIFYRTIRLMENGVKPVFVFDGTPPELKADERLKRDNRRAKAEDQLEVAKEIGDTVAMEKFRRRLVKVSEQHVEGVRRLLKLMGVPVIEAPSEAEAQCAELVKAGKVFATATEDMDALPFGSTVLLRNLFGKKQGNQTHMVKEYDLDKLLRGAKMSKEQFIDLCILLGCDYCPKIHGIGPQKALKLLSKHKSIENVLKRLNAKKYSPPPNWKFAEARKVFLEPDVIKGDDLAWADPDEDGILQFLCEENNFSEDRVRNGIARLQKARQQSKQNRIENFYKRDGVNSTVPSEGKRKAAESKNGTPKGGKRGGGPPAKRSK
ncbi:flap endonuclease 1-like protein [Aphelenchoides avenae]|nr:flap endonuclease 1-like protein [Aphelenchus avenae]